MIFETGDMNFNLPTRLIFGWGKINDIGSICEPFGKHALLVTMKELPHAEKVSDRLQSCGINTTLYGDCEPEPSIEGIDLGWETLKDGHYDFIIALGGGSVIDTAKTFRILNAAGGSAWDYTMEMGDSRRPVPDDLIPLIAAPTTAGTGAEVTWNAVVTNKSLKKKAPIRDPLNFPTIALVDPELTLTMPPKVTAATGFDAFTHAHECFFGSRALSPLAHQLCLTGMQMVVDNLETAIQEPDNRQARSSLSWASTQAGLLVGAIEMTGESAVHIFGLPIGANAGLAHGEALAITVGPITRYHTRKNPMRGRELMELFGTDTKGIADGELEDHLSSALESWLQRIGMVSTMSGYGMGPEMIDRLLESISLTRIKNSFDPTYTIDDIRKIYKECL